MREIPEAELEIMMIIWEYDRAVTRREIEDKLNAKGRFIDKTSILTYLKRLSKRGFVKITKDGKNNIFTALVPEKEYMQRESKRIIQSMYHNSLKNFVCALYDGEALSKEDLEELKTYIDKKL